MRDRVLVMGGGGVAGIAWLTGLALGLHEGGVDIAEADKIIGTSAGSTFAAQLAGYTDLAELYQRQVDPSLQVSEMKPSLDYWSLAWHVLPILMNYREPRKRNRAIGKLARAARTVAPEERLAIIDQRLQGKNWSDKDLVLIAVEIDSGKKLELHREIGVSLRDAVAASCAVPFAWPPVKIEGKLYMDGGLRSYDNADLAAGFRKVLILSPLGTKKKASKSALDGDIEKLKLKGAEVQIIAPDIASRTAMGSNVLAPESRLPSAAAGLEQGRVLAPELMSFWI